MNSPQDNTGVDLDTARTALEAGQALLIDIRESREHATGVAAGAVLLPMSELGHRLAELPNDPAQAVLVICNTQMRSRNVVSALRERGYVNVRYVHGGMASWAERGWPMVAPS